MGSSGSKGGTPDPPRPSAPSGVPPRGAAPPPRAAPPPPQRPPPPRGGGGGPAAPFRREVVPVDALNRLSSLTIEDDDPATLLATFERGITHPGIVSPTGVTLLHLAASQGALGCCLVLLALGVPASSQDGDGDVPAAIAIMKRNVLVTLALLNAAPAGPFTNTAGVHCLMLAATVGLVPVVEWFLQRGHSPNIRSGPVGSTPLMEAVRAGHIHCARMLLDAGADVATRTTSPPHVTVLHIAALFNNVESVHMLCSAGADPLAQDDDGDTPLHCAIQKGFGPMARGLLYASPASASLQMRAANRAGLTPLAMALPINAEFATALAVIADTPTNAVAAQEDLEAYLKSTTELDVPTMMRRMAEGASARAILIHGASGANDELCKFALSHAADLAWVDNDGDSILHLICYNDHDVLAPMLPALVAAGADVNMRNKRGFTALHIACLRDKPLFVDAILMLKSLVLDMQDGDGDSPLHAACGKARHSVVRELVKRGFDPRVTNKVGETPMHHAIRASDAASAFYLALQLPEVLKMKNHSDQAPTDLPFPAAVAVLERGLADLTAIPDREVAMSWQRGGGGEEGRFAVTPWRVKRYNMLEAGVTVEHPEHGRGVVIGVHTGRLCLRWERTGNITRYNVDVGCPDFQARELRAVSEDVVAADRRKKNNNAAAAR